MKILCEERYREACEHAEKTGDKSLQDCFEKLARWEERDESEFIIKKDFAPLSFYFEEYKDGERLLNGGVIYHGNPDVSRSITFDQRIGWQTHT
jgi:hypothetical protein